MTTQTMTKEQWKYSEHTCALADTGDYEGYVQFTNGKDILQSSGDEMEEEQLKQFCDLLNLMPDLWSHKCDGLEFENSQLKQQLSAEREKVGKLVEALKSIISQNQCCKEDYVISQIIGIAQQTLNEYDTATK